MKPSYTDKSSTFALVEPVHKCISSNGIWLRLSAVPTPTEALRQYCLKCYSADAAGSWMLACEVRDIITSAARLGLRFRATNPSRFETFISYTRAPSRMIPCKRTQCIEIKAHDDWRHRSCSCNQCYHSACLRQGCRPALVCCLLHSFVADPSVSCSGF